MPAPRWPSSLHGAGGTATEATRDLNATVYEGIGLSERQRGQLIGLLADLRVSGNEFDAERSNDVIEELRSRGRA